MIQTDVEVPTHTPAKLARVVWQLAPSVMADVAEALERSPQTRATIVEALSLAVALVDVQACRREWDRSARRAAERLVEIVALVGPSLATPECDSLDAPSPAYLGTRGERDARAAMALASDFTGYLHVDLAMAAVAAMGYGATVVDTMLTVAAVYYLTMMRSELTPPEERDVSCYQVALWRAYARCYGRNREETLA
jgi:hypothetical protein